ncbi:MAG: hypothetical protein RL748_4265 [Pseudomonadota bacterium]
MLVALFRLFSLLPLSLLHLLGAGLGWLVYALSPTYRKRLRQNCERAGFLSHLPQAIAEAGKSIAELPFVWCAPQERVTRHCQVDNFEMVLQRMAQGERILFLTPHLGCFELTAQMIALRTRLTAMYRPPRKAILRPLIEGARARSNLHLAPANLGGVRILAKELKKGHSVGILPDQTPQEGEGVWADFFGRPAYTMSLPIKLQQMAKATIILTYAERLPRGRGFVVRFVPFGELPDAPLAEQARAINQAMEALIARCPAQYFWSYNRYKVPPGVNGPDANGHAPSGTTADSAATQASAAGSPAAGSPAASSTSNTEVA